MAVDRKKIKAVMTALEKEYGEGSVITLGSTKQMNIPRWSTGLEQLDEILGGGIPYGIVMEICGPESAGKTSLAHHLTAQHEVALNIPIEGSFDAKRAKVFGNRKGQLIVRRAQYGEQCLEATMAFADAGIPCVVIDSVPSMLPKKFYEESDMEREMQMAPVATMLSKQLPKVVMKCENTGTTLIFINQLRDNVGGFAFGPTTHSPGGRTLKHANSIKLIVNRYQDIVIPNKDPRNSAKNEVIGIMMKVKVEKSKVSNPRGECLLALIFDRGFVAVDEVADIRKEVMRERNLAAKARRASRQDDEGDDE